MLLSSATSHQKPAVSPAFLEQCDEERKLLDWHSFAPTPPSSPVRRTAAVASSRKRTRESTQDRLSREAKRPRSTEGDDMLWLNASREAGSPEPPTQVIHLVNGTVAFSDDDHRFFLATFHVELGRDPSVSNSYIVGKIAKKVRSSLSYATFLCFMSPLSSLCHSVQHGDADTPR